MHRGLPDLRFAPSPVVRPLGLVLFVAGIIAAAAAWIEFDTLEQRSAAARQRKLESESTPPPTAVLNPSARISERLSASVRSELGTPWAQLFVALDQSTSPRVRLLSLEPDARSGQLTVVGLADDPGAAFDYLERLGRELGEKAVLKSQERATDIESSTVRFVAALRWLAPAGQAQGSR
jgi:hypothetical protein